MKITKVTVGYGRTHNLGNYSNVRPEILIEATLENGDDPEVVKAELQQQARAHVWEECDRALEREGQAAEFWTGPRYDALRLVEEKFIAIVPHKANLPKPWDSVSHAQSHWRFYALVDYVRERYPDYEVADFSNIDFDELTGVSTPLPELENYQVIWLQQSGKPLYCLILFGEFDTKALPEIWNTWRLTTHKSYTRFPANFLPWITEEANRKEATLINCLDGDLGKLPDLSPKETPATEIEPDMDEPIEDDDEDEWDNYDDEDED